MGSTEVVKLYVYDLSNGAAKTMTLGVVDAVYHTGVFVFGEEYSYGPRGIKISPPGRERPYDDRPDEIEYIGETSVSYERFKRYIRRLREGDFRASYYNVAKHNCNIFSNTLCQYLCNTNIPQYILDLQEAPPVQWMPWFPWPWTTKKK